MTIQDGIRLIENKIQQESDGHEAELERLASLREQEEAKFSEAMERLQGERDKIVLKEKAKSFPAELVAGHVTCSFCGGAMRPFQVAGEGGKVRKFWACQNSNLSPTNEHDVVVVM